MCDCSSDESTAQSDISLLRIDGRCHVIKSLQDQVHLMSREKRDFDAVLSRAQLAERALKVKEAEYKLKLDDLTFEISELKGENAQLKKQLMRPISITNQFEDFQEEEEESEMTQKYKKWKTKYKSLVESDAGIGAAAQLIDLQTKISEFTDEIERMREENAQEKERNRQLSAQITQISAEHKKTQGTALDSSYKVQKLQEEIAALKEENKRLENERQQKSTLLQHTRALHEKNLKGKQHAEALQKSQVDLHRKQMAEQSAEIAKLNERIDREVKEKKAMAKDAAKAKKKHDAEVADLMSKITEISAQNDSLIQQLDESKNESSMLELNISEIKRQNDQLSTEISRTEKVRMNNRILKESISQMKATIDDLENSVSSAEETARARIDQIRSLLARNFTGIDLSTSWDNIIEFIDDLIHKYHNASDENTSHQKKLRKAMKVSSAMEKQASMIQEEAKQRNAELESKLQSCQAQLRDMKLKATDKTAIFRGVVRKKVEKHFTDSNKRIAQAITLLGGDEAYFPSMRDVVLAVVFAVRWRHFKSSEPFDGSIITEYASGAKVRGKLLKELIERASRASSQLKESSAQVDSTSKQNAEYRTKIDSLELDLKKSQASVSKHIQTNTELNHNLESAQHKIEMMVPPEKYASLQSKLEKKINECKSIEQQMGDLKTEMKRLLESMDDKHHDFEELHGNVEALTEENEALKHQIEDLKHELDVSEVALREKTREILALERRSLKQKTQVVVIKDKIPASAVTSPKSEEPDESCRDSFYLNDALRNGLAEMQNKMMKHEKLI